MDETQKMPYTWKSKTVDEINRYIRVFIIHYIFPSLNHCGYLSLQRIPHTFDWKYFRGKSKRIVDIQRKFQECLFT